MEKETHEHIIHSYFRQLKEYGRSISKNHDEEAIHHFRVTTKKLRAYLRMLSLAYADPNELKLPKKIKQMFKAVGPTRDEQLHHKRLRENLKGSGIPVSRLFPPKKSESKEHLLSQKDFDEEEEKLLSKIPAQFNDEIVQAFFQKNQKGIEDVCKAGNFSDAGLHQIRKHLKDVIHVSKLWGDEQLTSSYMLKEDDGLEKADNLADELGFYIDTCAALSILTPVFIRNANEKYRPALRSARQKWMAQKRRMKRKILPMIENWNRYKLPGKDDQPA